MSIRAGVYRVGETIQITGIATNTDGNVSLNVPLIRIVLKKPNEYEASLTYSLIPVGGIVEMDIKPQGPNEIGEWRVRLECDLPTPTVREGKFEVVDSTVIPELDMLG